MQIMQIPNAPRDSSIVPNLYPCFDLKMFPIPRPLTNVNGQGEEGGQAGTSGGTSPQPADPGTLL